MCSEDRNDIFSEGKKCVNHMRVNFEEAPFDFGVIYTSVKISGSAVYLNCTKIISGNYSE